MGAVLSKPKTPALAVPEAPPPPPTIDDAKRGQIEGDRARMRRGRAATILSGDQGDTTKPTTGASKLLGY